MTVESVFPSTEIQDLFDQSRRILLITHVAPDGDAIGSMLALGLMLGVRGKNVTLACEDRVPANYCWMEGSGEIVQEAEGVYDLVVSLDCSDQRRMGTVYLDDFATLPLLNIDHHVTNTGFGTVNWVDPESVATAQMICTLADGLGWEVTQPVASCLLTGMVTDTRSFRTTNVDLTAMGVALRLMEAGASLSEIASRVLDRRPLAAVRLWGEAIDGLYLEDGILWTAVTRVMLQRWDLDENDSSGLANFLSGVSEARAIVIFTERQDGIVDVGMRSVPGYNVAEPAFRLGGGGHPLAAGCTLTGELVDVQKQVLTELRRSLAEQGAGGV
jgi:phosphoesterase RecJ-like protein